MSEHSEMGWNDVLGKVRRCKQPVGSADVRNWCNKILKEQISFSLKTAEYREGAKAAAQAILNQEEMDYKGPANIVEHMRASFG